MEDNFEEIRNLVGYLQLKVSDLQGQIAEVRASLEEGIERLETKMSANSFKTGDPLPKKSKETPKKILPPQPPGA